MDRLITIIGGSGFVGRYVVQELAKTGARLRVAVRDPQTALFLSIGAAGLSSNSPAPPPALIQLNLAG